MRYHPTRAGTSRSQRHLGSSEGAQSQRANFRGTARACTRNSPRPALMLCVLDYLCSLMRFERRTLRLEALQDVEPEGQTLVAFAACAFDFGAGADSILAVKPA